MSAKKSKSSPSNVAMWPQFNRPVLAVGNVAEMNEMRQKARAFDLLVHTKQITKKHAKMALEIAGAS